MGILSKINLSFSRIECLTLFFYIAHIFGLIWAIVLIAITVSKRGTEEDTVGEFSLKISSEIQIMFYVASGVLILTVAVGYLAQRWPDKSSLWILYCILLSTVTVVMLAASISSYTSANTKKLAVDAMKSSMEDEDNSISKTKKETKWDRLQKKYKCCGTETYQDWQDVRFGRTSLRVPRSCCLPKTDKNPLCGLVLPVTEKNKIYEKGCHDPALEDLRHFLNILSGIGFFVAAVHSLLTLLSCYLVVSKKV